MRRYPARMARALALVLAGVTGIASGAGCRKHATGPEVRIAAAADLEKAFTEVGAEFERQSGIRAELTFGSSGLLAKQVEQGAGFDLFAAANRSFVDQVVKAGKCDGGTAQVYGRGKIVAWVGTGKQAPATLADLADPKWKKIAIANPDHAPYGLAAKQALEHAGVWSQIQDRIVLAENVQATMTYARDGNADVAIVALSLAVVADGGTFLAIDESLYQPLDQAMVVCGTGEGAAAARQFEAFVNSVDGHEVMTRYGFAVPTK